MSFSGFPRVFQEKLFYPGFPGLSEPCVRIRSFIGPYFPAFGLNTDQKNVEFGQLSRSVSVKCAFGTVSSI